MVAAGHGIAFYPGGPPSEGATDFLWMLSLSAGAVMGVPPALVGLALNALGLGAVACAFLALLRQDTPRGTRFVVWLAVLTLVTMPWAVAGLLGFGTTAYAALALALYASFVGSRPERVPWLALTIALVRPDGAVLAMGFALLQAATARRVAPLRRRALAFGWSLAALLGLVYFGWRWRYFGGWLPLPLVVKRHFPLPAPGVADMWDWISSTALPSLGFLVVVRLWLSRLRPTPIQLLGLVPFVAHLAAFVHTTPSQNIVNRFEAPAEVVLGYLCIRLLASVPPQRSSWQHTGLLVALFFGSLIPRWMVVRPELVAALQPTHYATRFGKALGTIAESRPPAAPRLRLATTEAGRLAFDLDGPVLDLVGLCSAETAKAPPSFALLDAFDPDVVIVHPAGSLDENRIDQGTRSPFRHVAEPLVPMLWPPFLHRATPTAPPYAVAPWLGAAPPDLIENIRGAPPPTFAWLDAHRDRFEVSAVGIAARYARYHIVAVRRGLGDTAALMSALRAAALAR